MANISVYLNPKASQSSHSFNAEEIKKYFFRHDILINNPGSVEELIAGVKRDKKNEVEYIFSIGGDGTAHTIAQHLVGGKTKLLVLAGGTANDFADEVGTSGSLKKLAHIFHARTTRKVDIITVNDRYLMSCGGIGVAQKVAELVNSCRKDSSMFNQFLQKTGKHAYALVFLKHIMTSPFKMHEVYVDSPDLPLIDKRVESPLILVTNQPKLAGKFPVAPKTRNDDGKYNVTIFLHKNKFDFCKSVAVFMQGKYPETDKNIIQFETDSLTLTSLTHEKLSFFGDGESWEPAMELKMGIIPKGLEVISKGDEIFTGYSLDEIPHIQ